jgi:hypothetical protein
MAQSWRIAATAKATIAPAPDPRPCPVKPDPQPPHRCGRPVDLVICLDTSGSMTGLIDSARAKLWDVVTELVRVEPNAKLRVGLLTYGTPSNSTAARGWVYRHSDLTTDLDSVYARMMEMCTNGGDEFVGWVLNDAVNTMSWSSAPNALKLVFVAGNESADQCSTQFNFRQVAREARNKGIIINSIYAGHHNTGVNEAWDQVARHGGGDYFAIDQNAATVQISTPQDKVLIELNAQLNATYVPYGDAGRAGADRQKEQDDNAAKFGEQTAASRVEAKATVAYENARWDLVDAVANEPDFDVAKLEKKDLPAELRKMAPQEQRAYVGQMQQRRAEVQRQIQQVSQEREEFVRDQRARQAPGQEGLDDAMKKVIRAQAGS